MRETRRALAETLSRIGSLIGDGQSRDDVLDVEQLSNESGVPRDVVRMLLDGEEPPAEDITDRIVRRIVHLRETRLRPDGTRHSYDEIAASYGASRASLSNLVNSRRKTPSPQTPPSHMPSRQALPPQVPSEQVPSQQTGSGARPAPVARWHPPRPASRRSSSASPTAGSPPNRRPRSTTPSSPSCAAWRERRTIRWLGCAVRTGCGSWPRAPHNWPKKSFSW